jgi:4-aminobutyrate aminotransferase/(S)-3-amino-2-methylpropionate transaminase
MSAHVPETTTDRLLARREAVVANGVPHGTRIAADQGLGAILTDVDGRDFIDLSSGIGVTTLGHSDPHVVEAIIRQASKLQHACMHIATYEGYVALCEQLVRLLPHGESTRAVLLNSGSEAVENAIKIARQATGRSSVICFTGAFHGRTLLSMTLTSKVSYKLGCGPFANGVFRLPDPLVREFHDDPDTVAERALAELRQAFFDTVAPEDVAAILIEPVLGEGGFYHAPVAYLRGLREICDQYGIALIFDEVQTGFCRTGDWGAYQRLGIIPDLSTWAKAMGGGLPVSAVVGKERVINAAKRGTLGGTFGGNPIACAAALATLRRMEELDLCSRANVVGQRLRDRYQMLADAYPEVVDVRGLGAMVAIEFCVDGDVAQPATEAVRKILTHCRENGVLMLSAGVYGNVIRALPALVITDAQLDQALDVLQDSVHAVLR